MIPIIEGALNKQYAMQERARTEAGMLGVGPSAPSYGQLIANDLANAEARVQQLQRIQELLAKNPEFEELLTLVGRVGRY